MTDWKEEFRSRGALWTYDGDPENPHFELSSGAHSDGYFDAQKILEDPFYLEKVVMGLASKLARSGLSVGDVGRVVGPVMGAITPAHDMARVLSRNVIPLGFPPVFCSYAERSIEPGVKRLFFDRTEIIAGESVLIVDTLLSMGGSVRRTALAVLDREGIVLPFVGVIVNFSGLGELDGRKIVSLVDLVVDTWTPEQCPLCEAGSKAVCLRDQESRETFRRSRGGFSIIR